MGTFATVWRTPSWADATLTFTYDSGGRQTSAATSGAAGQPTVTLTYGYNATGDRTSMSDSLGSQGLTSYQYDSGHRLTTITRSLGGTAGPEVDFTYDNNSRVTKVARTIGGSGTEIDSNSRYDNAGDVGTITYEVAGSLPWATYAYGYDAANRLTSETNPEGTVSYTYDAADELTRVSGARSESYSYDSGGNRNMAGYTTTTGNELTAGAGYTFTYDNKGNTISQTEVATGDKTDYTWDYRNRLTGVVEHSSGGSLLMQATYTYDALGRRIGTDTTVGGVETKMWTVYDGENTYADFDGSGTLETRYLYGPAVDEILARTSSGGTTAWYMTDRLGSVRDVVDPSGTVLDHVSYDSYGNILSESNAGNGDRWKFAGREYDAQAILYYNRARYYNGVIGRWTQRDPIGFAAGDANVYRYAENSPTNGVDPEGTEIKKIVKEGDKMTIYIEITIYGKVTQELAERWSKAATDRWSGKTSQGKDLRVEVKVNTGRDDKSGPNPIRVLPSTGDPAKDRPVSSPLIPDNGLNPVTSPGYGTWYTKISDYEVAHEVGHLLGWRDTYTGNGQPMQGFQKTIMGEFGGSSTTRTGLPGYPTYLDLTYDRYQQYAPKSASQGSK